MALSPNYICIDTGEADNLKLLLEEFTKMVKLSLGGCSSVSSISIYHLDKSIFRSWSEDLKGGQSKYDPMLYFFAISNLNGGNFGYEKVWFQNEIKITWNNTIDGFLVEYKTKSFDQIERSVSLPLVMNLGVSSHGITYVMRIYTEEEANVQHILAVQAHRAVEELHKKLVSEPDELDW